MIINVIQYRRKIFTVEKKMRELWKRHYGVYIVNMVFIYTRQASWQAIQIKVIDVSIEKAHHRLAVNKRRLLFREPINAFNASTAIIALSFCPAYVNWHGSSTRWICVRTHMLRNFAFFFYGNKSITRSNNILSSFSLAIGEKRKFRQYTRTCSACTVHLTCLV